MAIRHLKCANSIGTCLVKPVHHKGRRILRRALTLFTKLYHAHVCKRQWCNDGWARTATTSARKYLQYAYYEHTES
jgi:hypothetical protein